MYVVFYEVPNRSVGVYWDIWDIEGWNTALTQTPERQKDRKGKQNREKLKQVSILDKIQMRHYRYLINGRQMKTLCPRIRSCGSLLTVQTESIDMTDNEYPVVYRQSNEPSLSQNHCRSYQHHEQQQHFTRTSTATTTHQQTSELHLHWHTASPRHAGP